MPLAYCLEVVGTLSDCTWLDRVRGVLGWWDTRSVKLKLSCRRDWICSLSCCPGTKTECHCVRTQATSSSMGRREVEGPELELLNVKDHENPTSQVLVESRASLPCLSLPHTHFWFCRSPVQETGFQIAFPNRVGKGGLHIPLQSSLMGSMVFKHF